MITVDCVGVHFDEDSNSVHESCGWCDSTWSAKTYNLKSQGSYIQALHSAYVQSVDAMVATAKRLFSGPDSDTDVSVTDIQPEDRAIGAEAVHAEAQAVCCVSCCVTQYICLFKSSR